MAGMRAFFVPTDEIGAAQGSKVGIGWLARLAAEKVAGEPMIIVHAKNMAGNNKFMAAASATFRWETTRTWYGSPWHGGPVLALFPTARALNAILERSHLITYLCVVESSGERPEAWLRARRPTYLIGAPPPESPALDPEVAGALVSLTAFVNTAHYGNAEDVAQGIWTCQQLMRLGYRLDAAAFESFALVNRWDPEAASHFGETVRQVAAGHRFRNRELSHLPARASAAVRKFWRQEGQQHLAAAPDEDPSRTG
jgi:hypothetical protein